MANNNRNDYSRFLSIYANIPLKLRNDIIAIVDEQPYTWNSSYLEISNNTETGKKIYKQLIKMEII
ncbi:hypothetical protein IKF81_02280 [Candidatus Saccharibacteria bacterium]|nr:hypothetical protein [Candidatus Saccharibacteria bacterium]